MSSLDQLQVALHGDHGSTTVTPTASAAGFGWRRWFLPLVVVVLGLAFVAVTWRHFVPLQSVSVIRIAAAPAAATAAVSTTSTAAAGTAASPDGQQTVAFQAAGWLEPDPFPIRVTALVSGVIASVAVTQGEMVTKGQELARLDQADFNLAVQHATADVASAQAQLAETQQRLAVLQAERQQLTARVAAQQALVHELADYAERRRNAPKVYSESDVRQASLRHEKSLHDLVAVEQSLVIWQQHVAAAEAAIAVARSNLQAKEIYLDHAQLDTERSIIRAPVDGMIMVLHAVPGRKQMLGSDNPLSTTVAELFDPQQVQVRVDVALADAGGLVIGQEATITTTVLPGITMRGVVTRIEGHADIARNTLQAKVRIIDPDQRLRPEMSMRVQFFAAPAKEKVSASLGDLGDLGYFGERQPTNNGAIVGMVPTSFVADAQDGSWSGWLVDADNRLQPVTLALGEQLGSSVVVRSGAPLGSWLVASAPGGLATLQPGQRVRVQIEQPGDAR